MNKEFYRTEEIAELFGVTRQMVAIWRKQGKLKPIKLGERTFVYPVEEVRKFIKEREKK